MLHMPTVIPCAVLIWCDYAHHQDCLLGQENGIHHVNNLVRQLDEMT
jgi:hypothetical protein